jgi:ubiquitin-like-conjugating enzyme ATG10
MLSAFPHLNDAEFDEACCDLLQRFHRIRDRQTEWLSVEKECRHETACLSITKHLPDHARVPVDDDDELDHYHYQVLEDDAVRLRFRWASH